MIDIWVNGHKIKQAREEAVRMSVRFLKARGWEALEVYDIKTVALFTPGYGEPKSKAADFSKFTA